MAAEILWQAHSQTPAATEALGEVLGRTLAAGTLIALDGELGSGKTTFVRGLARGLEVPGPVSSPTYTRMRALEGRLPLHHFDAWRPGGEELFLEGVELLCGDGVAVVEWAERVEELLPRPRIELQLAHLGPERRSIQAWSPLSRGGPEAAALALRRTLEAVAEGARTIPGLEFIVP